MEAKRFLQRIKRLYSLPSITSQAICVVFFLIVAPVPSIAQITTVTAEQAPPIPGAGHDYIKLFNETVSPAVGAVDIRIDAGTPAGRGGTVPFIIGYDSNSARHFNDGTPVAYDNGGYLSQGGWRYVVPELQYLVTVYQVAGPAGTAPINCDTVDHYVFTDLEGTLHPLGLNSSPNSWIGCPGTPDAQAWPGASISQNSDGLVTATTTPLNATPAASPQAPPLTVFNQDGLLYSFSNAFGRAHSTGRYWFLTAGGNNIPASNNAVSGMPDLMEDRNGNQVIYNDDDQSLSSSGAFHITDTLGRTAIRSSSFGNPTGDTVTVSGLSQPFTLSWGTATFNWSYNAHVVAPPLPSYWFCAVPSGSTNTHIGGISPATADAQGTASGSGPVVTALGLPNGLSYQFLYDNPNGDNPFGLLRKIIYPNGAYVRYVWALNPASTPVMYGAFNVPPSPGVNTAPPSAGTACEAIIDAPAVSKRFVSFDGVHEVLEQDFSYSTTWALTNNIAGAAFKAWSQKQTTVVTKDLVTNTSFTTTYSYVPVTDLALGNDVSGAIGQFTGVYQVHPEEKTILYEDGSGNVLQTITKGGIMKEFVPPQNVLTTLDNGLSSLTRTDYKGTVFTDEYQYDFGTTVSDPVTNANPFPLGPHGPLLRHIHADYNHVFPSNPLMPPAGSFSTAISDRPSDEIAYDGNGNRVAEMDYCYDGDTSSFTGCGSSSLASASATEHDDQNFSTSFVSGRGNATTKIVKCFSGASQTACTQGDSITVYGYDQTGQQISKKDPNGNTTTYSFADSFNDPAPPSNATAPPGNTNGYLTKITYPTTSGISHIVSFSYAYSDGSLTVATDENGNQSKYTYNDSLRRLTESDFPDGGQTTRTYNDSGSNPNVITNKKIDSGHTSVTTMVADGMGQSIQAQLNSDPSGVDYTDTIYDGLGRVISNSNPHRSTSAATDGVTQTTYDALGRVTQVTRQDGSISSISYAANCSIALDETGKRRRACSDSLRRLVEADEPTPGTSESITATNATATLTLSGNLESKPSSNPATGAITISGTDSIVPGTSAYDFGTVTVTIGTASVSTSYGNSGSSPSAASDVASALCTQITNTSSTNSQVSCNTNVNVINLTAQAPGTAGNGIALAVSARTSNPQSNQSAFASSSTSGSLSGGGTPIYDSGTTTIAISGRAYNAFWSGSSTTAASIASSLASTINGDTTGFVTVSVSGGTISVTAKDLGMSGNNISLACSSSYDTNDFTTPSFSIACPSALSGGHEAGSLSAPMITLYSYDGLGNLLKVSQQGGTTDQTQWRIRTFSYDSLSRLLTATNPESGNISHVYDANGNILQRIAPAPNQPQGSTATQTISFCYDALNRVTDKSYTAQSPANGQPCPLTGIVVHQGYDSGTNGIGHLTSLTDQAGSGSYTYESMGRMSGEQRTIAGVSKSMGYVYNLDGSIQKLTYPSLAVITYTPDSAGRVGAVQDMGNSISYVTGTCGPSSNLACYDPTSAVSSFLSGAGSSFAGISNSFSFNNRLQPVNIVALAPNSSDATASIAITGSLQTSSGTGGTSGTGSVTFSGSEQSISGTAATSASGSVTINGSEKAKTTNPCLPVRRSCPVTIYDSGTVSITVNGFTKSASYKQGSTTSSIASALALAFNGDGSSPVQASASGNVVTLTSYATGSAANYSLSSGASTSDSSNFPTGSFTTVNSGSNLTGGQNGTPTVYDSGTCSITLSSTVYATTFGQGDTTGSIASRLAGNVNGDTLASAVASGATVSLTAKATGTASNYPLSSSCSYNSSSFSSPSFTASSPSALSGGTNGSPGATDAGTVSLAIGSFTATACFGNSTNTACSAQQGNNTAGQVATALANAINVPGSPATATVNGTTLNLVWKTAGNVTTAVSALSTTHDQPGLFPNPSFTSPATSFSGGGPVPVFSIAYDFHAGNGDNGNLFGITNNRNTSRGQSFTYDALNRLITAQNAGTDCTQKTVNNVTKFWGNSYSYDVWGNLLQKTPTKCSGETLSVVANTQNQIHTGTTPDYAYDVAGNMTHDATTGANYSFDPENRINGANGYTYIYDADGNRVEKSNGSTGTIYWYMLLGVVAESDLGGNLKSEYVFFNGEHVARKDFPGNAVSYYFSDHLRSAAVVTDSLGNIKEDEDYYPWGGELQFVNNDSNHYKFTGKERDGTAQTETGLDYFGARHYSNWLGRFISADPAVVSSELSDPQTLNKYSYAFNRPLVLVDPDGKWPTWYHHVIIEDQFTNLVGSHGVQVLEAASDWVDSLPNQAPELSYMHAMSDGAHHQSVEQATQQTNNYIDTEVNAAVDSQIKYEQAGGKGNSDDALTHFGHALHTVTDRESPEHAGYQPWYCLICASALQHSRLEEASSKSKDVADERARYEAHIAAIRLWQLYQARLREARKKNQQSDAEKKKKKKKKKRPTRQNGQGDQI